MSTNATQGHLIALVGPRNVGKTTIRQILTSKYNYQYSPIKKFSSISVDPVLYNNISKADRVSIWRDYTKKQLERGTNIVLDDCTATIEYDAVASLGGVVWQIRRIGVREELYEFEGDSRLIPGYTFVNDLSIGLDQLTHKIERTLKRQAKLTLMTVERTPKGSV